MTRLGLLCICVLGFVAYEVSSHGYMTDPPNRSSLWRFGYDSPPNYDDNQLYCGGYDVQWGQNNGQCGECGDAYNLPRPRPNEDGGEWGLGIITRNYQMNQVIPIAVNITTSHEGYFTWRICPNNDVTKPVEQSCLDQYVMQLSDGSGTEYRLTTFDAKMYYANLQLPAGLTCSQCVVQWWYTTGNTWGDCGNGTEATGCGPQECFVNCADVSIS